MDLASTDLQTLRAFVAVAREGNVSRAAERLHRSQPAISLQLKRLSEETGLILFHRASHGLTLSADGAALLPQAERVLDAMGDFRLSISRLRSTLRGRLRIGTILEPHFIRLGAFLGGLVATAPQLTTELRHGMSGTVLGQIQRGDLDVGFFLSPSITATQSIQPSMAVRTLGRFGYRVVAPAGWEARVRGRDWTALAELPWLGTPPESVHHRLLAEVFGPARLTPRYSALVDQETSMLDLLRSGVGLSLVREEVAIRESQAHGLVIVEDVRLPCELQFISLASRREEPVVGAGWDALAKVWAS